MENVTRILVQIKGEVQGDDRVISYRYVFTGGLAKTQGVRMYRFFVIVFSVLLLAAFLFASQGALSGLLFLPGWAPYQ